jgi:hypothetical protein
MERRSVAAPAQCKKLFADELGIASAPQAEAIVKGLRATTGGGVRRI